MEFGVLLRLVSVMNLTLLLSHHLIYKGENLIRVILLLKKKPNFDVGFCSDIYTPNSFKHCVMIEITMLYILMSVWITLTFIQAHSCMRNQTLSGLFSQTFHSCVGLFELMVKLFCTSTVQGRELC